jgi:hypothetical protein
MWELFSLDPGALDLKLLYLLIVGYMLANVIASAILSPFALLRKEWAGRACMPPLIAGAAIAAIPKLASLIGGWFGANSKKKAAAAEQKKIEDANAVYEGKVGNWQAGLASGVKGALDMFGPQITTQTGSTSSSQRSHSVNKKEDTTGLKGVLAQNYGNDLVASSRLPAGTRERRAAGINKAYGGKAAEARNKVARRSGGAMSAEQLAIGDPNERARVGSLLDLNQQIEAEEYGRKQAAMNNAAKFTQDWATQVADATQSGSTQSNQQTQGPGDIGAAMQYYQLSAPMAPTVVTRRV